MNEVTREQLAEAVARFEGCAQLVDGFWERPPHHPRWGRLFPATDLLTDDGAAFRVLVAMLEAGKRPLIYRLDGGVCIALPTLRHVVRAKLPHESIFRAALAVGVLEVAGGE